jgi:hypothetical protein
MIRESLNHSWIISFLKLVEKFEFLVRKYNSNSPSGDRSLGTVLSSQKAGGLCDTRSRSVSSGRERKAGGLSPAVADRRAISFAAAL